MQVDEEEKLKRRKQLIIQGFVIPILIGAALAWVGLERRMPLNFRDAPLLSLVIFLLATAAVSAFFVGQSCVILHRSWKKIDEQRASTSDRLDLEPHEQVTPGSGRPGGEVRREIMDGEPTRIRWKYVLSGLALAVWLAYVIFLTEGTKREDVISTTGIAVGLAALFTRVFLNKRKGRG
jgi:hypothetical protein